ncbi:unnamed protein product [Somion occarium]|uniref:Uncharacterized protein n=1 Tax=Somion occarium TaxID=3059160 RepID=A0ABP1CW86_9APHY
MFQRLRNLLGTITPRRQVNSASQRSASQDNNTRSSTPDSLQAALASWTLILDEHIFLDRIITNDLVYDLIFHACTARTLVRLLRTCRAVNVAVKEYISRAFNVHRLLSRYFSDPMAFRYIQACTGTLISGSAALQFFDRSLYPDSDLDLYVPMPWRKKVGHFLLAQGYKFEPYPFQHPTFDVAISDRRVVTARGLYGNLKGIAGVFTFEKKSARGEELKVQIIVAVRSTMEVILRFHSTCVMNVISFDRAYCLYPLATLEQRRSLVCTSRNDEVAQRVFEKYSERGWKIVKSFYVPPAYYCIEDPAFSLGPRWIDDGYTWSIPLKHSFDQCITPVNPPSTPLTRDPVSASSWDIKRASDGMGADMVFSPVHVPQLFYHYILNDTACLDTPSISALLKAAALANSCPPSYVWIEERRL